MFTPEEVRSIEFNKSTVGGYKTADVDYFLEDVAVTIETLEKEKAELKKKLEVLAAKIEEYRDDENSIHIALVNAQRLADQLKKDAQKTADETLTKAEFKKDKILADAETQSSEMLQSAKKRATDLIVDATAKAEAILNAANGSVAAQHDMYVKIREEAANFRGTLLSYYKAHLEQIDKLSEIVDADPGSAADDAVNKLGGNHILNDDFNIEIKPFEDDETVSYSEAAADESAEKIYEEQVSYGEEPDQDYGNFAAQAGQAESEEETADEEYAEEREMVGAAVSEAPEAMKPKGGFTVTLDDFADDDDDDFAEAEGSKLRFGGYDIEEEDDYDDDEKTGFGFFRRHKK